jgi:hypothetical protein
VNYQDFKDFEWIFPETTLNFDKLELAYRGFCAYMLSQPNLLLIPANTHIGVLQYNNNFYAFSTKEAAYAFMKNIAKFVSRFFQFKFFLIIGKRFCRFLEPQAKLYKLLRKIQNLYNS